MLHYYAFRILIFNCDSIESNNGIKVDILGLTCVNLSKMRHKDDHFLLASTINQVFYVDNPMESGWFTTLLAEPRNISPNNDQDKVETLEN